MVFWMAVPIQALWGLYGPPILALMTRHVAPSQQGNLQGALGSVRGIGFMIGPGIFTFTFASCIAAGRDWEVPGAPFLLAAALLAAAAVLAWHTTRPAPRPRIFLDTPVADL
jgi:DHA1 family tetracycline resistance protein-like MFS transporter